jgi:nucleoside 2-deoxyribosyltransferase
MKIKKVYIASPLFNEEEIKLNEKIDRVLKKAGFETFLPQRDGFVFEELTNELKKYDVPSGQTEDVALALITYLDIYQVCIGCDATVLNLNGRVPDEGAVCEAALAFRSEKPLVIYKDDARSLFKGYDNPLVVGLTGFRIVGKISQIPEALKAQEAKTESTYSAMMKIASKLFKDYKSVDKNLLQFVKITPTIF